MNYPILEIDYSKIFHNASQMKYICDKYNISLSGVIKGVNGTIEVAKAFHEANHKHIASSRGRELKRIAEAELDRPRMRRRSPRRSEVDERSPGLGPVAGDDQGRNVNGVGFPGSPDTEGKRRGDLQRENRSRGQPWPCCQDENFGSR